MNAKWCMLLVCMLNGMIMLIIRNCYTTYISFVSAGLSYNDRHLMWSNMCMCKVLCLMIGLPNESSTSMTGFFFNFVDTGFGGLILHCRSMLKLGLINQLKD